MIWTVLVAIVAEVFPWVVIVWGFVSMVSKRTPRFNNLFFNACASPGLPMVNRNRFLQAYRNELRPFLITIAVLGGMAQILQNPDSWHNKIGAWIGMLFGLVYWCLDSGDDDDRWKKRRRALKRVFEARGRLVTDTT